ncbi:ACP S-malonyltransferase [Blattabacterium cuenoti]|uniref:ACP S-malonyltransferase n=1 Tax=Blattabacterium cuenoti TaxID=1653831 RepID=UPI00163B8F6F|nr:ACP S-malonyltransferase [Blattabacterium cuenoti]
MKAYLFSGQGSQYPGMGKKLYEKNDLAKKIFHKANDILGFYITSIMFEGSKEDLKKTKNAQLSIYIYSIIETMIYKFEPDMVAGNSLGELSALTSANVLSFEDGLKLVYERANIMQKICETIPGKMMVIFGLNHKIIEHICKKDNGIVVVSNYNSPNQLVISGESLSVKRVCSILSRIGAKKIICLPVHGAFHSPIMKLAKKDFEIIVNKIDFKKPKFPIYQNVNGLPVSNPNEIKKNIIKQIFSPVKWMHSIRSMIINGANSFIEIGPGKILKNMAEKYIKNFKKKM